MSIKPCPACESADSVHFDCLYDDVMEYRRECTNCGTCGPIAESEAEADAAWNAMPRRGDGLAWRPEPPDRSGWWLTAWPVPGHTDFRAGSFTSCQSYDFNDEPWIPAWLKKKHKPGMMYAGPFQAMPLPIPEPPSLDAEKEAAK